MTIIDRDWMIGHYLAVSTNQGILGVNIIHCTKNAAGHQMCAEHCEIQHYRIGLCKKSKDHYICVCSNA